MAGDIPQKCTNPMSSNSFLRLPIFLSGFSDLSELY
jgi:hypothetical protein